MKDLPVEFLAHRNNLLQKQKRVKGKESSLLKLVESANTAYNKYISKLDFDEIQKGNLKNAVAALEEYLNFAKQLESENALFNWRSDYASSIIPEFLFITIDSFLRFNNFQPSYSTKESVVEFFLTGNVDSQIEIRKKNQDFCMGFSKTTLPSKTEQIEFFIPTVVFEVKTNIDINKLNGLDFSAERLKRSFPHSKYFLVTETIDFSLDYNFAANNLDEVYVLRKQLRSKARKEKSSLKYDVFEELLNDVLQVSKNILSTRGHVYTRLQKGKLIKND